MIVAKIQDNEVVDCVDAPDSAWCNEFLGGEWVGYVPSRKNTPGIGYQYDSQKDVFIPKKIISSHVLDETSATWVHPPSKSVVYLKLPESQAELLSRLLSYISTNTEDLFYDYIARGQDFYLRLSLSDTISLGRNLNIQSITDALTRINLPNKDQFLANVQAGQGRTTTIQILIPGSWSALTVTLP